VSLHSPSVPPGPTPEQSNSRPGCVLALDVGLRRTGLARSDPDRRIALGLPTFEAAHGRSIRKHIQALYEEEPFTGVVIGLPFHTSGRPGDLAATVRRLGQWITGTFGVPVAYQDERFTTEEAAGLIREAPRRVRSEKGVRDRLAAQIILREFLAAGCPFRDAEEQR